MKNLFSKHWKIPVREIAVLVSPISEWTNCEALRISPCGDS